MKFLEELAARRRFGMRPGLETIRSLCAVLGNPQEAFSAIHVAGTNGKGAVCAILDAALRASGWRVGRYTSPHLVQLNERFFLDGAPVNDEALERMAEKAGRATKDESRELTFFEALTAVAFLLYAEAKVDCAILECGLGGRLDATNICRPRLCVITKIGLDHCDWLGNTVEQIAAEKCGILKSGIPVVLGANTPEVVAVVKARATAVGAPFHYAPELATEAEIPSDFSLFGAFNRENAVTALAALKVLKQSSAAALAGFGRVVWPGRYQRIGDVLVDGAHNPPAAAALAASLRRDGVAPKSLVLVCGFCGDKEVGPVLAALAPLVRQAFAVRTNNPRSLAAAATADRLRAAGLDAVACDSLAAALASARAAAASSAPAAAAKVPRILVCGSLFLAGEMLTILGNAPWAQTRFDPAESLHA